MLSNGGSNSGGNTGTDSFKTAVIDTLVAEVQAEPGADRCVLLLGYKKQMEEMFEVSFFLYVHAAAHSWPY